MSKERKLEDAITRYNEKFVGINNKIIVSGNFKSDFKFSHVSYGYAFFSNTLNVSRISGKVDEIPIVISDELLDDKKSEIQQGKKVLIEGFLRSRRYIGEDDGKKHLFVYLAAKSINLCSDVNENIVLLSGKINKRPNYHISPFGWKVTDLIIEVKRPSCISDYIPCIAWGNDAIYTKKLKIGDEISFFGRIQSRYYQKEEEKFKRQVYEVSIFDIEEVIEK